MDLASSAFGDTMPETDSGRPAPQPIFDAVADVLARQVRDRGSQPAILSTLGGCTFRELDELVGRCAQGLARLGIGPGSVVGLLCTNRIEWVVAALGTIVAGGQVAAFNTWAKRWDLDHLLSASNCEVLVALSAFGSTDQQPLLRELLPEAWEARAPGWRTSKYPRLRELVLIGPASGPPGARPFDELLTPETTQIEPAAWGALHRAAPSAHDATALILYTSGSTARPKAVPLQQGTALEHGYDVGVRMGVSTGDRVWLPVPLFWSYGGANALMVALTHGCTLVLQEIFDAGEALDLIEQHRCRVAYSLPNITAALLSHPAFSPERVSSLERGMTIGSGADVAAAATGLGIKAICNAYGSTEIYGCCSATPHDWPLERKLQSQGPPLPRIQVTITDPESGQPIPVGETGEITVSGQVTPGYLGEEHRHSAAFGERGRYRTGDLGHLDAAGNVVFAARATEMIKSGGINIAPAEIEEYLLTHPAVVEAAVSGAEDGAAGQVAIAFVTLGAPSAADEAELDSFCREGIASFKVPARIVVVDGPLPVTATGKVARSVIRDLARNVWNEARP